MRVLILVALALGLLFGLGLVALAVALPRYVDTPEVRQAIEESSAARLGRPIDYEDLDVGLLPPSLIVVRPVLPGRHDADPPFFRADRGSLRLAILPLLTGTVEVVSNVIDGLEVTLIVEDEGMWLPGAPEAESGEPESVQPTTDDEDSESVIDLAVRRVELRDASVRLIDRTRQPPVEIRIEELALTAAGEGGGHPLEVKGSARLGRGGRMELSGSATLDATGELVFDFDDVSMDAVSPYLGVDTHLAGHVDATLRISGDVAAPSGSFDVDATSADLRYAGILTKPAGVPARVRGTLETTPNGALRIHATSLRLASLDAQVKVETAGSVSLGVDAPPFDLEGFAVLLPGLEGYPLSGKASIDALQVRLDPLRVGGAVHLDRAHVALPGADGVSTSGRLVGRGDRIVLDGIRLSAGGQQVAVAGDVRELAGAMPFALQIESVGVLRANPLVSSLSTLKDVVYGPLTLAGRISGRAAAGESDAAVLESLDGELRFDLGKSAGDGKQGGRIAGLSMLDAVMGAAGQLGAMMKLTSMLSGGKLPDLSRYTGDEFEQITGDFRLGQGMLRTRNLRMLYRTYGVDLSGTLGLVDNALDMQGELTLGKDVAKAFGADASGGKIVIPIAHIGGTLDDPVLGVKENALTSLATHVLLKNPVMRGTVGQAAKELEKVVPDPTKVLGKGLDNVFRAPDSRPDASRSGRPGPSPTAPPR